MDTALSELVSQENDVVDTSADEQLRVSVGCGKFYLFMKRLADLVFSFLGLIVLSIPMVMISILIRLDSEGPAIFKQKRMGKNGRIFVIYKFRTMMLDAPRDVASCRLENSEQYMTKFGQFLRRTSIDELPQLINIFKGDMSIIGYRPVCLTEEKLNHLREAYGVFALRPGITGLAQVSGRDNINYKDKARLDAQYVSMCSARTDILCLLRTIKIVISGEGVN